MKSDKPQLIAGHPVWASQGLHEHGVRGHRNQHFGDSARQHSCNGERRLPLLVSNTPVMEGGSIQSHDLVAGGASPRSQP